MISSWAALASLPPVALLSFYLGRVSIRNTYGKYLPALKTTTFDLIGSSEQIRALSKDLESSSQEQLDSLMSTAAASHKIRSMIESTSANATQLNSDANHLQGMARTGRGVISKMVESSQEIKQGAELFGSEMQQSIEQLTKALNVIQGIAQKTQAISEIVFQTKLLSFNASVEAARAGEAGKGFSVVAEEVGKLANMSGNVSNEISKIVENSVSVVQQAINTTKTKISALSSQIVTISDAGYQNANACEKIFNQMMENIDQTSKMIERISSAAVEQAVDVAQLDKSILALQEVADRNRLVASQTTEYGQEFDSQTKALTQSFEGLSQLQPVKNDSKRLQEFIWNDRLVLGVPAMDQEHKILVEKINTLVGELEKQAFQKDPEQLMGAFQALAQYTQEHFSDEEKFMESIDYPAKVSHQKIHMKLLQQVSAYGLALQNGTLNDQKLISFLRNWLISHIMGVDMKYAKHHFSKPSELDQKSPAKAV